MSKTFRNLSFAAILAVAAGALLPTQASALSISECSTKFRAAKAAGTDAGMKWNDFRKTQCAADAAPAAGVVPAVAAAPAAPAAAAAPVVAGSFLKECSASWKAMKAAGTVPAGMKYKDFVAAKCVAAAAPAAPAAPAVKAAAPAAPMAPVAKAPAAPVAATKAAAPATTAAAPAAGAMVDKNGKPISAGRAAMTVRIRACSVKWKAAKAAGTLPADQKWPQFWSACNKELKAQGQ